MWRRRPDILLCPNIPKPMHGLAPRVVLGQAWWNETRRAAYASTNYRCQACGVHKSNAKRHQWLEGHELYFTDYRKGRLTYLETVPLCHYCHNFIHDGRMTTLVKKGEMAHGTFATIVNHGNKILREAGLQRPTLSERDAAIYQLELQGKLARWEDWRLVLFGVEYPPLHATYEDWERAHANIDQSGHGNYRVGFAARSAALLRDHLRRKRT